MTAFLRLRGLHKQYGGVQALASVDFEVGKGEIVGLIGANGAGKSTLVKVLAGGVVPDAGEIIIDGVSVELSTPKDARAAGIALVSQELELVGDQSVADNIFLGHLPRRGRFVRQRDLIERARHQLDVIRAPHIDPRTRAEDLTPVDQRLVTIARGLALEPRVLVLDEPTAALPVDAADRLLPLLQQLAQSGTGVVYVSHRLGEILQICTRVVAMRNGSVVGNMPRAEVTRERMVELVGGRAGQADAAAAAKAPPRTTGEVVLRARGVNGAMVQGLDLEVRAGEILGIGGLQGSGRSELLRLLEGTQPLKAGTVELLGGGPSRSARDAARRKIGYIAEGRGRMALRTLDVTENMTITEVGRLTKGGFFVSRAKQREAARSMAGRLQLKGALDAPIETLSGGNQQKVFLGRWLLSGSRLLLLDEPTAGIDVGARAEFHAILRELAHQGTAVVVASAEPEELALLCHRVVVLARGRICGEFDAPFDAERVIAASYAGS